MLTSYYKSENRDFTLLKGDCKTLLDEFEFKFDCIFADPPYFLSSGGISCHAGKIVCVDKGQWDKPTSVSDMDTFNFEWLYKCRNHLKDSGTIWICGTHHNIFSVQQQLTALGFKILNIITWVKTNPPPNISCRYFTHSTEFVIWARKDAKVPHYYDYRLMKSLNYGKQMTDVWKLPAVSTWEKSQGKHPTQKPLALLSRIIQASTRENEWILDPFCGSGTTGVAASLLGRRFLGLEKEQEYLDMAKARREELESPSIRHTYQNKLIKANIIPDKTVLHLSETECCDYGVPW